jgi:hypothetical protein
MRIYLDDQPCDWTAHCVGEALAQGAAQAEAAGRLIVHVHVDGERLDDEQLHSDAVASMSAADVRLTSVPAGDLVQQTLRDARSVLDELCQEQADAADLIEAGKTADAGDALGTVIGSWMNVQQALGMAAQVMDWDMDDAADAQHTIGQVIEQLSEQLVSLRQAIEQNDPIGVSDALRYDLSDIAQTWNTMLGTLIERSQHG